MIQLVETEAPKKRRKRSRLGWILATAVIAAIGIAAYFFFSSKQSTTYQSAAVDRGDIESSITATGNCNAVVTVQVGSQVSGNILQLFADFNTKVKKGQLVARIDPALFQAAVDQSNANLEAARAAVITAEATLARSQSDFTAAQANIATQKANLVKAQSAVELAKIGMERRETLFKQGVTSQEEADTARAAYEQAVASVNAAQAALDAAEASADASKKQIDVAQNQLGQTRAVVKQNAASLQTAQLNLDHTAIIAPVDGTVVARNMDVGQTVAASFQAPTIFLIAQDLTKMQVDTNVDESDVGPIRVGQQANFTVDAYPGVIFPAAVAQIRQAPINVQNVVTYDVVVNVANPDLKLFPGMTATVKILTGRVANALRIPVAAMRFRPQARAKNASQSLYILDGGEPKPVAVKLGLSDGSYIQVVSGLSEGDRVVTGSTAKPAQQQQPAGGTRRVGF
ncbi:MAG: efflux RND transporter periplasmic adaptor subunit [Acidobacteriia bacterium]|nr:efflux RND transporter periplasmic adaptor subunit [Terriglobia bacterium]